MRSEKYYAYSMWFLLIVYPLMGIADIKFFENDLNYIWLRLAVTFTLFVCYSLAVNSRWDLRYTYSFMLLMITVHHAVLISSVAPEAHYVYVFSLICLHAVCYILPGFSPTIVSVNYFITIISVYLFLVSNKISPTQVFLNGGFAWLPLICIPFVKRQNYYEAVSNLSTFKTTDNNEEKTLASPASKPQNKQITEPQNTDALVRVTEESADYYPAGIPQPASNHSVFEDQKNQNLRIATHDLRNNISAINGISEIMEDQIQRLDRDELDDSLQMIREASENMLGIINRLVSPQVNADAPIHNEVFELNQMLTYIIQPLAEQASQKNIAIKLKYTQKEIYIKADRVYFTTIVRNIFNYAVKFSEKDNTIIFSTSVRFNKGYIDVIDRHRGFEKTELDYLFNKLNIEKTSTSQDSTTGIGLSVAKALTEKMHGRLDYDTSPDLGTRILLAFDLASK